MNSTERRLDSLAVVDANAHDYTMLCSELGRHGVRLSLYATGEDALRAAGLAAPTVWIINSRLPDMSGVHLLMLVRLRAEGCSAFLVGDVYSAADEMEARSAGATGYMCKPACAAWLKDCRPNSRSPTIRAGPEPFS